MLVQVQIQNLHDAVRERYQVARSVQLVGGASTDELSNPAQEVAAIQGPTPRAHTGQLQSSRTTGGTDEPGGGKGRLKVNASGVGPSWFSRSSRATASAGVGSVPAGIHHAVAYICIGTNHFRRCRMTAACSAP